MAGPVYSADDFLAALQGFMPKGRVWPRDSDAAITQVLGGIAPSCQRLNARANQLLIDGFPASTEELLPEWEETLGLPDPCAGLSPTIEQRRAQVVARFIASGGQSIAYFISVALALGYVITITQFTPFSCGMPIGQPLCGEPWAFAWQVNAPLFSIEYFETGVSRCGEPLAYWSNAVLECEIRRLAPAHTIVLFSYT